MWEADLLVTTPTMLEVGLLRWDTSDFTSCNHERHINPKSCLYLNSNVPIRELFLTLVVWVWSVNKKPGNIFNESVWLNKIKCQFNIWAVTLSIDLPFEFS